MTERRIEHLREEAKMAEMAQENQYQEQENKYSERLLYEYERYENMQRESAHTKDDLEKQLLQLKNDSNQKISDLSKKYEDQIESLNKNFEEVKQVLEKVQNKHDQEKRDIAESGKQKLHNQRTRYDVLLAAERERGILDKNELAVLRKKVSHLQKEIQEKKSDVETLHIQHQEQQVCIKGLHEDIERFKQELLVRDRIIRHQERVVTAMKIKQRENEKLTSLLELRQPTSREISTDIESFPSEQHEVITSAQTSAVIRLHPVHVPRLAEKNTNKQNKSM